MTMTPDHRKDAILEAALPHVAFDGWSATTFRAACRDAEIAYEEARGLFPRGSVDLAAYFHKAGDQAMAERLKSEDLSALRFREKVATAVRYRLEAIDDKEAVRRAATLFALPHHAGDSASLLWGTADRIWTELGDTSDDINWYTKRATLSGVYASTVLYWLGDDSIGHADTWAFLDRRIGDVMQFEKVKAQVNRLPGMAQLNQALSRLVPAPKGYRDDMPGYTSEMTDAR